MVLFIIVMVKIANASSGLKIFTTIPLSKSSVPPAHFSNDTSTVPFTPTLPRFLKLVLLLSSSWFSTLSLFDLQSQYFNHPALQWQSLFSSWLKYSYNTFSSMSLVWLPCNTLPSSYPPGHLSAFSIFIISVLSSLPSLSIFDSIIYYLK